MLHSEAFLCAPGENSYASVIAQQTLYICLRRLKNMFTIFPSDALPDFEGRLSRPSTLTVLLSISFSGSLHVSFIHSDALILDTDKVIFITFSCHNV